MLNLERLEERNPAATLVFNWDHSPYPEWSPFAEVIRHTAATMASRLVPPGGLPEVARGYLALTPWGLVEHPETTPADVLTVYVGTAQPQNLGEAGPVSWSASGGGLERSPGFTLAVNPDPAKWSVYSLPSVVAHETVHGFGFMAHIGFSVSSPIPLMNSQSVPHTAAVLTPPDVAAVRSAGFEVWSLPSDHIVRAKGGIWGSGGFALLDVRAAGILYQQGAFTDFDLLPPGSPHIG